MGDSQEEPTAQSEGESTDSQPITQAVSTATQKVVGETAATSAAGVLGRTTDGSTVTYGVVGETQSSSDGAAGVRGDATALSGQTYGVHGITDSTDVGASGVRGESPGAVNAAIRGINLHFPSGESDGFTAPIGVFGQVDDQNGNGVLGQATSWSGVANGVLGRTESKSGAGVMGRTEGASGAGVLGRAEGTSGAGVRGEHSGGGPAIEADGYQTTHEVGAMAYLGSNQSVSGNTQATVAFDTTERVDAVVSFDTSTGVCTVQEPGDYVVDWQIEWHDAFADQTVVGYALVVNSIGATGFDVDVTEHGVAFRNFSKPVWNLDTDDTVRVQVNPIGSESWDIEGLSNRHNTFMSIRKFG